MAADRLVGLTVMVAEFTVNEYSWLPVYGPVPVLESLAWRVKVKLPPAVGVPVSAPLVESSKPAGKLPDVTENV